MPRNLVGERVVVAHRVMRPLVARVTGALESPSQPNGVFAAACQDTDDAEDASAIADPGQVTVGQNPRPDVAANSTRTEEHISHGNGAASHKFVVRGRRRAGPLRQSDRQW